VENELSLIEGPGGWVLARLDGDDDANRVWVHFLKDSDGRWQPTWHVGPITPGAANVTIPVRRVALAVNASEAIKAGLEKRMAEKVPLPGTAEWVEAFGGFAKPELRFVLERPAGHRLSDAFYLDVARAYRGALERGLNPRTVIANDTDVSLDVAGRWIYQARKRGFLPKTTSGRVEV
jgi:hypothetical protein